MFRKYDSVRRHMENLRRNAGIENSELDNYYRSR